MDLDTRKIASVQEFLKLQSEDVVSRFEKILKKEKKNTSDSPYEPMSHEELNKRIHQSEADFRKNRFKSSSELLAKYR